MTSSTIAVSLSHTERARRYLAKAGPAIQGSGGYAHTGKVIWALVRTFDLTDEDAMEVLQEWNLECAPPWSYRELTSALQRARRRADDHPCAARKEQGTNPCPTWFNPSATVNAVPEDRDTSQLEPLRGVRLLDGTPGADYLSSREIPLALAKMSGVLYHLSFFGCPAIIFPLRDRDCRFLAGAGRYLDDKKPKARNAGRKADGIFRTPGAMTGRRVFITEAPLDALSLAAAGYPAIALAGVDYARWLPRACASRHVVLATDADDGGDRAVRNLAPALLTAGVRWDRLSPSPAKDFNQFLEWYGIDSLRQSIEAWIKLVVPLSLER